MARYTYEFVHIGCVQHEIWFNRLRSILYAVDPNAFASLAILNRKWRRISDSSLLYAHHLARCPSFAVTQEPVSYAEGLQSLKRKLLSEARRNMFEIFLRPRRTLVKLISTSMSSSTAFPQGEAFRFSFSVSGQMILCISSSRIVVLDVTTESPTVRHELKTSRRPLDATILDDGSLLAVVSSRHQINVYTLSNEEPKLIQCLVLNDTPRALALSPSGGVLAIAYDDKIEVQALGEGVLTTDRRAVRCNGIDSIAFSSDGFMLLGSSASHQTRTVVSVAVPFYTGTDDDTSPSDAQVQMWTTQILFPDKIAGYTRACLLPLHGEGEDDWILGYDEQIKAFRAIRNNNANSGAIYFVGPVLENRAQEASPTIFPTVGNEGKLVALGFQDNGLWIYGVPDHLDVASPTNQTNGADSASDHAPTPSVETQSIPQDNRARLQQTISEPKILVSGHKMSDIPGITAARWIRYSHSTMNQVSKGLRLVTVAPGGVRPPTIGEEDVPVDGGRVLLLDFGRSAKDGEMVELSIEVGETQPKILKEPNSSMDTEVELERRRTRLHRGNTAPPRRSRNAARESFPSAVSNNQKLWPRHRRNSSHITGLPNNTTPNGASPLINPPSNNTQAPLHRAATAAATSRPRYNPPFPSDTQRRIPQIPHESDADNWIPPPPPYTREPEVPLPDHLRRTLLPVPTEPVQRTQDIPARVRRAQTTRFQAEVQANPSRSLPVLHRLNTITARVRRRDPETDDSVREQRTVPERTREGSFQTPQRPNASTTPTAPPPQTPRAQQAPVSANITHISPRMNPIPSSPPVSPRSRGPRRRVQTTSTTPSSQTDHVVSQAMAHNLMEPQPIVPNPGQQQQEEEETPTINHYPFSLSSPNLRVQRPQQNTYASEEIPPTPTARRTWYQRAPGRSQSQDIGQITTPETPTPGLYIPMIPPMHRRASTDPTLSTRSPSSAAANENWRRRIEEWNERTIHETSKKNRSKCAVM